MDQIFLKLNRYFQGFWRLGVLAEERGLWTVPWQHLRFLKAQNAMGRHILMQPTETIQAQYLMADDLTFEHIHRHHQISKNRWKPGRLVVETSPCNYQIWIRCDRPLTLKEKRYWLNRLHSDPRADPHGRWGRCPGFFNRKSKHQYADGRYPLSRLIWIDWTQPVSIPDMPDTEPLARDTPFVPPIRHLTIQRENYQRFNESRTDFSYALALARRGISHNEIVARIQNERTQWTHHEGEKRTQQYLDRTVTNAIKIIQKTTQPNKNSK